MQTEIITRALADLTRLRIMRLLAHMELAVGELAHVLGQSQPRVSRHVAILCESGLAERRREGSWTFLRQTATPGDSGDDAGTLPAAVARMLEVAEAADAEFAARCAQDRRQLAAIRSVRERHAADYFARHAEDWDRLRAMLTPAEDVETALCRALGEAPLGRLLDIGTGTGRIAELLAPQSTHVVGFDRSPEMLRIARARLQDRPPGGWELVQGDFAALPFDPDSFDTVILHQVLHHAAEPAFPLAEAARVCRPGGRVVIVDLAAHQREELRERHAHARLGFTDEQIAGWLTAAGLKPAVPLALPGHQLTTKIWLAERQQGDHRTLQHKAAA